MRTTLLWSTLEPLIVPKQKQCLLLSTILLLLLVAFTDLIGANNIPLNNDLEEAFLVKAQKSAEYHPSKDDVHINQSKVSRYELAKFDFPHVATPYIISLWIVIVGLAKIGFHVTPKLSSICPESVVLMVLGVLIGFIFNYTTVSGTGSHTTNPSGHDSPGTPSQPLTPNLFFLYMLPPIVMDAGYHMPNRLFFDNLSSILLYAVVGTIWNALCIGLALYWCAQSGLFGVELPLLDTLLFSSIVSAVDPVAVLAIFEEIHVNEILYIIVFGESLLNDAVTVVLYHMFEGYTKMGAENIMGVDWAAGVASFFVIALGGTIMGVIWGFAAAFISRFTHHVKIIEPIFVFVMAYLSYLSAEMFHLSGILALTFCGITMKNYVEENISETSQTTLKYAMKMLANSSESIIFLFLGVSTVNDDHDWNTMFVILTIIFCLIFRSLGVILLTAIANRFRLHKLSAIEQFIMSYGGLRGAVAFALVLVVSEQIIPTKKMMVTTVIALVYFTVFLQGMTVGPLVKILKVPTANKYELTMNERIHTRLMDHLMAGIEDISGMMVGNYKIRDKFRHINNQYLMKWLLRDHKNKGNSRKFFETCSRLNLQDAINMVNKPNLLSVYNNNLTHNKSLSALFRTFTEANLTTINNESNGNGNDNENNNGDGHSGSGGGGGSGIDSSPLKIPMNDSSFNFDIGNVEYSPCKRDIADAEIHHILSDSMFQPIRRYRKYSRADLFDNPSSRPPFQHQMRLQIRHLVSNQGRGRRKHKKKSINDNLVEASTNNGHNNGNYTKTTSTSSLNRSSLQPPPTSHHAKPTNLYIPPINRPDRSPSLSEEGGITFTAKSTTSPESNSGQETPKTATESQLPWRRPSVVSEGSPGITGPLKQEEFPPWICNKDYVIKYASPTNTLLSTLDKPPKKPVYEIFTITEGTENQGTSGQSQSGKSSQEELNQGAAAGDQGTDLSTNNEFTKDESLNTVYRL